MGKMKLSTQNLNNETSVSNVFLDKYMKDANGEFVKVYLYILRCSVDSSKSISLSDIADQLNLTEKDVTRALKYWVKNKVIEAQFDDTTNEPIALTLLQLKETESVAHVQETVVPSVREIKEREDMQQLLYIIEKYVGRPLSSSDTKIIFNIKENLGFSSELIEFLTEYCVSNQHTSIRYIEKVALAWYDQGILTVEKAKGSVTMYSKRTNPVMKAFGISGRTLTPVETDFINRWYDEYGFDNSIIKEACNRTILSIGKPNFSYADSILKKWKNADVHTVEDAKKLDNVHRYSVTVPVGTRPAKSNQFNNISTRNYDFDELEKSLISNNR